MAAVEELYHKPGSPHYYGMTRGDVVKFLEKYVKAKGLKPQSALEIGCGGGKTGKMLKERLGLDYYAGVELMPEAAAQAKENIDWVMQGNVEEMIPEGRMGELPDRKYDLLLYLDVLEHLYNPWKVLEVTSKLLKPGGLLIGSIPNIGNLYILWKIMRDQFAYEEEGLLDKTHIRWFTASTIKDMVGKEFDLREMGSNHDTWKTMNWQQKVFYIGTLGLWKRLFIRQYLFIAEVKPEKNA